MTPGLSKSRSINAAKMQRADNSPAILSVPDSPGWIADKPAKRPGRRYRGCRADSLAFAADRRAGPRGDSRPVSGRGRRARGLHGATLQLPPGMTWAQALAGWDSVTGTPGT